MENTIEKLDKLFLYIEKPTTEFESNLVNLKFKEIFEKIDEHNNTQLSFNFLLKYSIFLASILELGVDKNLEKFKKVLDKLPTETIYQVFYILHGIFVKETYLGPSFSYVSADKRFVLEKREKSQEKKSKKIVYYDFENLVKNQFGIEIDQEHLAILRYKLRNINLYNHRLVKNSTFVNRQSENFQNYLECDGELWVRLLGNTHIFIISKFIINYLIENRIQESVFFYLWGGRFDYMHNSVLYIPTGTLKEKCLEKYQKFREIVLEKEKEKYDYVNKLFQVLINVEYSNVLLFFYQYNQSQKTLIDTQKLIGISYNFTGKMGVRTKYQTFKVAQLVVEAINDDERQAINEEEEQKLNPYSLVNKNEKIIKNQQFDEECILYETPKLDEEEQQQEEEQKNNDNDNKEQQQQKKEIVQIKTQKSELSLLDQVIILGIIKNIDITNPHDEVYQEQIQAYCNILVEKSHNWLVYTQSLFIRSLNEFEKFKRMERALLQLQTLLDQFNEKDPETISRILYLYSLNFPSQIEIQKIIAKKYMKVGMLKTACDIFEYLQMYEECVECLANSNEMARAKQMALNHIEKFPNSPKMLCLYGDLTQDIQYHKRAWKVSNKRFARAQRALGKYYFYTGKLEKSIKAFQKATSINSLTPDPFFTMGCAYMKLLDWKGAIRAFSSVICIDNSQADAWANMATSFMQMGKKQEAYSTLEQAVKHKEHNWQIWANLLQVSFMNKKFYKFFECIQRLVQLNKGIEIIDEGILQQLNQIFTFQISEYPKYAYKGPFETIKQRIERLYQLLGEKCGNNYFIWDHYANFVDLSIAFLEQQTKYDLASNAKIEKEYTLEKKSEQEEEPKSRIKFAVSTKPAFKTQDQVRQEFQEKRQTLFERIYQLRLNCLNVLMKSGWEESKEVCEKMEEKVKKLLEANREAERGETGKIEMERFVKTVKGPMEKNLGKQLDFQI